MYFYSNDLYKFIRRINVSTFDVRGRYTSLFYEVGEAEFSISMEIPFDIIGI